MTSQLEKVYYHSKTGYWKGSLAIQKLKEKTGLPEKQIKDWLKKQSLWQIYLPAPQNIVRPKFENLKPNDTHQCDLLFLPHDTIRRKKFKYALTVIDLASRYKDAEPLTTKSAEEVAQALKTIYGRGPLKFPRLLQCDSGSEFKGAFNQLLLKHHVLVRRGIPGLHRAQALVENFNKNLAERIFTYQYSKELFSDSVNTEWVVRLPRILREMNSQFNRAIEMKPVDAIKLKQIKSVTREQGTPDLSLLNAKVRYLYQPGEVANDSRKRATDPIWSLSVYEVDMAVNQNPPLYYLRQRSDRRTPLRGFVKEELQRVPPDTVPIPN